MDKMKLTLLWTISVIVAVLIQAAFLFYNEYLVYLNLFLVVIHIIGIIIIDKTYEGL